MGINEYTLEFHVRSVLDEARAVSARAALAREASSPRRTPALIAFVAAARAFYTRLVRLRLLAAGAR